MKNQIVIGLVGEKGSGKETVAGLIQELVQQIVPLSLRRENKQKQARKLKTAHVKFSDLLKETLALWSLPSTRKNLQDVAVFMEQGFGAGTLANALYERIVKLDADIVIIDGIRWDADIELLNRFPKHYLIYVTADLQTRFERVVQRVDKIGEGKDFKQFLAEEKAENELHIPRLAKKADFKIGNNSSLEKLAKQVAEFIQILKM